MTEKDYLWLICRTYIATRRGYITTIIAPAYEEMAMVLTSASGLQAHDTTDSDLLDYFKSGEATPAIATPPESSRSTKPKAKED